MQASLYEKQRFRCLNDVIGISVFRQNKVLLAGFPRRWCFHYIVWHEMITINTKICLLGIGCSLIRIILVSRQPLRPQFHPLHKNSFM